MTRKTRTYNVTFTADVDGVEGNVTIYSVEGRNRKQAIRRARRDCRLPDAELNRADVSTVIVK